MHHQSVRDEQPYGGSNVVYLPHARTAEPQKPRNTRNNRIVSQ
jgi:hypothetical protein